LYPEASSRRYAEASRITSSMILMSAGRICGEF
jgi:hypothetical protein